MARNRAPIEDLTRSLPLITLVTDEEPLSSLKDYLLGRTSFLSPFVKPIADNGGGLNDGIAMVEGTCLPGGRSCIYLHGIDHFAAVMNTSPYRTLSTKERLLIFQALL